MGHFHVRASLSLQVSSAAHAHLQQLLHSLANHFRPANPHGFTVCLTIDIRDYVTRIGNGARALHKVCIVLSVLRLLRAQQTETGSFYKFMVVIWTII